jgi:hypothetical protein
MSMERRHFLKLAFGFAAGAATLAASAQAAPLSLRQLVPNGLPSPDDDVHPAVTSSEEIENLKPEEVRWGHHWHRHWGGHWHRHRHWGWRRRHWHRWHRRWGWHRHHWHHRWRRHW